MRLEELLEAVEFNKSMFVQPYNIDTNADLRPANLSENAKKSYKKYEEIDWVPPEGMISGEHKHEIDYSEFTEDEKKKLKEAFANLVKYINDKNVLIYPETKQYKLKVHRIGDKSQFEEIQLSSSDKKYFFKQSKPKTTFLPLSKESYCYLETTPQDPIFFSVTRGEETVPQDFLKGQLEGKKILKLCRRLNPIGKNPSGAEVSHLLVNLGLPLNVDGTLPDNSKTPNSDLIKLYNEIIHIIVEKFYNTFYYSPYYRSDFYKNTSIEYKGDKTISIKVNTSTHPFYKGRSIKFVGGASDGIYKIETIVRKDGDGDTTVVTMTLDRKISETDEKKEQIEIVGFDYLKRQVPGYECDERYVTMPFSPAGYTRKETDIPQTDMNKIRQVLNKESRRTFFSADRIYFQVMFEINQMIETLLIKAGKVLKIIGVYSPLLTKGTTPEIILDKRHIALERISDRPPTSSIFRPPEKNSVITEYRFRGGGGKKKKSKKKQRGGTNVAERLDSSQVISSLERGANFSAATLPNQNRERNATIKRIETKFNEIKTQTFSHDDFIGKLNEINELIPGIRTSSKSPKFLKEFKEFIEELFQNKIREIKTEEFSQVDFIAKLNEIKDLLEVILEIDPESKKFLKEFKEFIEELFQNKIQEIKTEEFSQVDFIAKLNEIKDLLEVILEIDPESKKFLKEFKEFIEELFQNKIREIKTPRDVFIGKLNEIKYLSEVILKIDPESIEKLFKNKIREIKTEQFSQVDFIAKLNEIKDLSEVIHEIDPKSKNFLEELKDLSHKNMEVFNQETKPTGQYIDTIFFGEFSLNTDSTNTDESPLPDMFKLKISGGGRRKKIISKKKKKKRKQSKKLKKNNKKN